MDADFPQLQAEGPKLMASHNNPHPHKMPDEVLLANAADFLNGGIEMLFAKTATSRSAKIAIVAIQTSLELLAKFRLVREKGLSFIIEGALPQGTIGQITAQKNFRTIGYAKCLQALNDIEPLNKMDKELVHEVANLRNRLVHFAEDVDLREIRITAAHLVLKGLNRFAAGDTRDIGEFQNHGTILTEANFRTLTNFGPYRAEAVDDATDCADSDEVFRCWECGVYSLSLRPSGTYFCHCCGLTADSGVAEFTGCCACGQTQAVVYDPLNTTNGRHHGKCLVCGVRPFVVICKECGVAYSLLGKKSKSCPHCIGNERIGGSVSASQRT